MRTSELRGGGDVTISSHMFYSDNYFSSMSTLADAMRSMDMSCSPDSLISYPHFPYHVPPARVLVRFLYVLRVLPYVYGLSTCPRLLVCFTFLLLSRQLVHLRFLLMLFPFMFGRLV